MGVTSKLYHVALWCMQCRMAVLGLAWWLV
jgi:hypothetical protein